MKDFLGNDIHVGDEIVYGAALGRCAALCHAVVLEVREDAKRKQYGGNPVKLQVRRLKAQNPGYKMTNAERERVIGLQFPERCVVTKPVYVL